MKEQFGKVFKIIRESKNMSLKEVAGEYVTPAQLSRFENGKSNLTVDTFFYCLGNMDVLQGEFSTFYNNYYGIRDIRLSNELYEAIQNRNIDFLRRSLTEYECKYRVTARKSDRLMIAVLHVFINKCDSTIDIPREEKSVITDYLMSIDEWCRYELWILSNCARSLETQALEVLGQEAVTRSQFYDSIEENRRKTYGLLLNITGILLDRGEERIASKFIKILDNFNILDNYLIEKLQLKFCKAHLRYLQGFEDALDIMKECLKMTNLVESYSISRQIEQTISQLTDM
ncbi:MULTISPECIES: Rgg/GadR/MutR family transcriptional regulator [unclassified Facklamia]|uniref:helix-turn-helix domain-containing protein n=1 Tax=Aerococcaceae TaxID=186827 RepID=UPI0013B6C0C6|nr:MULTISPECIES: Rgg/GadR/MutR family transcriptional regulator [unclassified Facklamia]NEW64049.1 helix-turn-helix domain-containing protein [Facklamia sp. 252]NEW67506.1 helix-turn-helix domain-containing protein [Facklamia sp. 253]QQD65758.1 helix-turn-helix domain-containing protein [Aerococcaceae bacterium zg-252]